MHGLPMNIDLCFIEVKKLEQVCIGEHQIILNFEDALSISIETAIHVHESDNNLRTFELLRDSAQSLCSLLGLCVQRAVGSPDGTLSLEFENGTRLVVYDDNENYESYQIRFGDKLIVV